MATLTKSILPISGYTDQYYTYQCIVTENSYSVANNTSNVTITFSIKGPWNPSFYEWVTYYGIVVDGAVKTSSSSSPYITTSYKQLLTWTGNIAHGSDGKKSINVGVYLYQSSPANYLPKQYTSSSTLSMGSVALTTIPRASSVSLSATSVNVGNSITATISRASSSFTHTVEFYINNTYYQKYTSVGTSQAFTIPTSWYNAMPSSTSCTAYCRITTYNGSTQIGSQVSKAFTVNVPSSVVPTVGTITLDPVNITTTDGTSRNILVKGKNKLAVSVSGCSAGTGSSIRSYTFSGPGISSTTTNTSVTSGSTISNTGTLTYTVKVTDKRGRTASKTQNIVCYDYRTPSFTAFDAYRANSNGAENNNGTYLKCTYSVSYASVNSTNTPTVKITYTTGGTTKTVTASGGSALINLGENAATYQVYAKVTDLYNGSASSSTKNVFGATRIFNVTKDGTGFAIGKMAESNNLFESRWPIKSGDPENSMQNLSYRGNNLISSTTNDTTTEWGKQKNLATTFYTATEQINNQPSQYGFLLNLTNGDKEVHQVWATQSSGSLLHRGGNASGWNGSWKEVLDSSNYTKYVPTTDYVVAQGTSGNFTYRKWNSGVAEAWYHKELGQISLTTAKASGVWSNDTYQAVDVTLPSGLFNAAPTATGNVCSNGYTCLQVSTTTATQIAYRIWAPYSSSPTGCVVSIQLVGRWK